MEESGNEPSPVEEAETAHNTSDRVTEGGRV